VAPRLLAALGLALALVLGGCTWSREEPGLFRVRSPSPTPAPDPEPPGPLPAAPLGNPELPVAGDLVWTTGEGARVTARFAVHALRRIPGATILDYSVTPLQGPGLRPGDALPGDVDFGLSRSAGQDPVIWLLDPRRGQVHRSLHHTSRREFNHCLCTPLWAAQPLMRVGQTRLLQAGFPALPRGVGFLDVVLANQPPVVHVPVTPVGQVPTARVRVDLTRPPDPPRSAGSPLVFGSRPGDGQALGSLTVDRVVASPGSTALQWTLRSTSEDLDYRRRPLGLPVVAPPAEGVELANALPVSGPTLSPGRSRSLPVSWMTAQVVDRPAYECLCSDLGLWARSLDQPAGAAQLTSLYPPLPAGTQTVQVRAAGLAAVTVPVHPAADAAARLGPPTRSPGRSWVYSVRVPPLGWSPEEWPSPLPDPWQLVDYRGAVERVTALPHS
jgi:hypothetical protein